MSGYAVTYAGQEKTPEGYTRYVLDFKHENGRAFTLKPVVYKSNKEQWIQNPDLKLYFEKDIYVAVSPSLMFNENGQGDPNEVKLARGDSTVLGEKQFAVAFKAFDLNVDRSAMPDSTEIAVAAVLDVTNLQTGERQTVKPVYMIMKNRMQQSVRAGIPAWGVDLTFAGMNVNTGEINLIVQGVNVTPQDWLVVQAYEKPFINLVWLGIIIMSIGFVFAYNRRVGDVVQSARQQERAAVAA
jgi:cytochrome c-type biogenesis protein CcmF